MVSRGMGHLPGDAPRSFELHKESCGAPPEINVLSPEICIQDLADP